MGNKSRSSSGSSQQSVKVTNKSSVSNTDSRSYTNVDAKSYTNIDDRSYTNIDSSNLSTNISNTDNRSVSEIALDCGINPKDVENYTNDESVNINQDNSQNLVSSGDGNTLENITQKMNLTSYGPKIQKCMQDAVSKIESANVTKGDLASKNNTASKTASKNATANKVATQIKQESKNTTEQVSKSVQDTTQKSEQKSDLKQTAGMGSGSGGHDILIIMIILTIVSYILYPQIFNKLKFMNNCELNIILGIYLLIIYLN
jgi:coenzyme F420-reducing hydrogenase alpha subunit